MPLGETSKQHVRLKVPQRTCVCSYPRDTDWRCRGFQNDRIVVLVERKSGMEQTHPRFAPEWSGRERWRWRSFSLCYSSGTRSTSNYRSNNITQVAISPAALPNTRDASTSVRYPLGVMIGGGVVLMSLSIWRNVHAPLCCTGRGEDHRNGEGLTQQQI